MSGLRSWCDEEDGRMSMGRRKRRQESLFVATSELARSAGHPFYRKLNELLAAAGFDRWIERRCEGYYEAADKPGRESIPPGTFFRMLLVVARAGRRDEALLDRGRGAQSRPDSAPTVRSWQAKGPPRSSRARRACAPCRRDAQQTIPPSDRSMLRFHPTLRNAEPARCNVLTHFQKTVRSTDC